MKVHCSFKKVKNGNLYSYSVCSTRKLANKYQSRNKKIAKKSFDRINNGNEMKHVN